MSLISIHLVCLVFASSFKPSIQIIKSKLDEQFIRTTLYLLRSFGKKFCKSKKAVENDACPSNYTSYEKNYTVFHWLLLIAPMSHTFICLSLSVERTFLNWQPLSENEHFSDQSPICDEYEYLKITFMGIVQLQLCSHTIHSRNTLSQWGQNY